MKERKIIKIRVDMYEDTKFKIIDTKPERDLIHYIWTRTLTLAGKVNLEGELYLSKNIPYTAETLAIEFNRSAEQVEVALKVLMDLEIIEFSNNVYRVTNFAKHQNIKNRDKIKDSEDDEKIKNNEEERIKSNVGEENDKFNDENCEDSEICEEIKIENKVENKINFDIKRINDKEIKEGETMEKDAQTNSQTQIPIVLNKKKTKETSKKNNKKVINEIKAIDEKDCVFESYEGIDCIQLNDCEVIKSFVF